MEEIKVNGNFAVKVGKLWATKDTYSGGVALHEQPESLMEFSKAYELSEKVGGEVYIFRPEPITKEKMEDLRLAADMKSDKE